MEGFVFVYLIGIVLLIVIQWVVAKKFEKIAIQKGYDEEINSFAMCFWLGIVGYLYVIALPDLTIPHIHIPQKPSWTHPLLKKMLIFNRTSAQHAKREFHMG